ncbi:unnamed protein product [Mucor hiemalis]
MESMGSVISVFFGIFFSHTIEIDEATDLAYLMLYEAYSARYSIKTIVKSQIVRDALRKYNEGWTIESMKAYKKPLIMVTAGVMEQQPIQATFLGRAVEEKFHLSAASISIVPCIPLVSNRLKGMVHPDIVPTQLSAGEKEGYYVVDLNMKQNFENGPDYYNMSDYREDHTAGVNADNITDDDGGDELSDHSDNEELPSELPTRTRNLDNTRNLNAEVEEDLMMEESRDLRAYENISFSDFDYDSDPEDESNRGNRRNYYQDEKRQQSFNVESSAGHSNRNSNNTTRSRYATFIEDIEDGYESTASDRKREAEIHRYDKPQEEISLDDYEMTKSDYEREEEIENPLARKHH